MKFQEIIKRINGISLPILGISWNPNQTDKDLAKETITFLEDKRVLYNPSDMEVPHHCVSSILEIRNFLTQKIGVVQGEELLKNLRAMRAACRKFLDYVGVDDDIVRFGSTHGHWASWRFNGAVGELRGVCGIHIAAIAVMYELDVEDNLASIFPIADEYND